MGLRVVDFYQPATAHFPDNLDPRVPVFIPPAARPALVDFLENGLTDPRVAAGEFPFDRPTLWMETNVPEPLQGLRRSSQSNGPDAEGLTADGP